MQIKTKAKCARFTIVSSELICNLHYYFGKVGSKSNVKNEFNKHVSHEQ